MMMLEKRDTLYEEKIVSMEKAIESIERKYMQEESEMSIL